MYHILLPRREGPGDEASSNAGLESAMSAISIVWTIVAVVLALSERVCPAIPCCVE